MGTLCAQQFYIDSFETSQVFWTWSEDMWFGYNPQIIFYFFCYFNLGIFLAFLLSKLMDTGYLVCATPPTNSFETLQMFLS